MITIGLEQATLERCLDEARHERVVLTRGGKPVALVVDVEGLDQSQLELGSSSEFWRFITERRAQKTLSRAQLEAQLFD